MLVSCCVIKMSCALIWGIVVLHLMKLFFLVISSVREPSQCLFIENIFCFSNYSTVPFYKTFVYMQDYLE